MQIQVHENTFGRIQNKFSAVQGSGGDLYDVGLPKSMRKHCRRYLFENEAKCVYGFILISRAAGMSPRSPLTGCCSCPNE